MLLLSCSNDTNPCPLLNQVWIQSGTITSFADVGITPEQMIFVIGWGFGVVLFGFLMGWGIGLAVGLIKQV